MVNLDRYVSRLFVRLLTLVGQSNFISFAAEEASPGVDSALHTPYGPNTEYTWPAVST